jgi:hypothetical protein
MLLWLSCVCATFGAGAGAVIQDDVKLQVPLQYVAFKDIPEMLRMAGGGSPGYLRAGREVSGYVLPKGAAASMLYRLPLDAFDKPVVAALGVKMPKTPAGTKRVIRQAPTLTEIWLDLNEDRKFSADENFKPQNVDGYSVFGPISGKDSEGAAVPAFYLAFRSVYYYSTVPAGYYTGELNLDGKAVKIGLVDGNANGVLGERTSESDEMPSYMGMGGGGDVLLVDFNGNGKFDVAALSYGSPNATAENRSISWLMQMPDRRFYHLRVAGDLSAATFERSAEEMGYVEAKCSKMTLSLSGPDGAVTFYPQESPLAVPPGGYQIGEVTLFSTDKQGKDWSVSVATSEERGPSIRVRSGKTVDLRCGGPIKIGLETSHYLNTHSVSITMVDSYGNDVNGLTKPDGNQPTPPKLNIVDANGKTVFSQSFSYG